MGARSSSTPLANVEPEFARVVAVVDGDTIRVEVHDGVRALRYIGMDAPEMDPRGPVEVLGRAAAEANRRLIEGKTVRLERDVSETDRFGRLLRYVYVETATGIVMVNAELVRLGFARAATFPPDVRYQELLLEMEREARNAGRGLWASLPVAPTLRVQ